MERPTDATAKHFDLRFQLRDETVSFAIPKGLSDWQLAGDKSETRLAIMTQRHPIAYSLFEGGRVGTTGCWDIGEINCMIIGQRSDRIHRQCTGTYKIKPTKASKRITKKHDVNGDTTDEDIDPGEQEEDKFDRQLHRTLFQDLPGRDGQSPTTFPNEADANKPTPHRGFHIELVGP